MQLATSLALCNDIPSLFHQAFGTSLGKFDSGVKMAARPKYDEKSLTKFVFRSYGTLVQEGMVLMYARAQVSENPSRNR